MIKTYVLFVALSFLFVSCGLFAPLNDTVTTTGAVKVRLATAPTARTISPDFDMNVVTCDVYGDGPGNTEFELLDVSDDVVECAGLVPGLWTITADGRNADGVVVGSGQSEAIVAAGDITEAEVEVTPRAGTGDLSVTVTWPAGVLDTPSVDAEVTPQPQSAELVLGDTSASYSGALSSGYYTFSITLYDNGVPVWGTIEAVRIIANVVSEKRYELAEDVNRGGLAVGVTPNMQNPVEVTLSGNAETLDQGTNMTVSATVGESEASYQWYLKGEAIDGATEAEITIGENLDVGVYWLDVIVTTGDTVGSATAVFEVIAANVMSVVDTDGNVGQMPSLGTDGTNVYVSYGDGDNYNVKFASSQDGGLSWSTQTLDAQGNVGLDSSLVVDETDVYISYPESITGDIRLRTSGDGGSSWASEIVESGVGARPSMLSDGTTLYVSYVGADGALLFAERPLSGGTWQKSMIRDGSYTAVDIAMAGSTIYVSAFNWDTRNLYCARSSDAGATWSVLTVDNSGLVGHYTAVTADGDSVYIGYYRYGRFYIAVSADRGATWDISIADDTSTSGQYLSMQLSGSTLMAAYFTSSGLRFARSTDEGASWTITTVDGAGSGAGGTAMAVNSNQVLIAYRHADDEELRFAKSCDGGLTW